MERNKSGRSSKGGQRQKYLVCVNLIVVNFLKTVLNNSCGNAIVWQQCEGFSWKV